MSSGSQIIKRQSMKIFWGGVFQKVMQNGAIFALVKHRHRHHATLGFLQVHLVSLPSLWDLTRTTNAEVTLLLILDDLE